MKLVSKIRLIVSGLVALSAAAAALLVYVGYDALVRDIQIQSVEQRARLEVRRLNVAFQEIHHDIRMLGTLPQITMIADAGGSASQEELKHLKDSVAVVFREMLRAKPHYAQIRFIGVAEDGLEIVRLDREESLTLRVPEEELQSKGHRNYFTEITTHPEKRVYTSRIDLNWEWKRMETPHRPMLRLSIPVYGQSDRLFGIVVINLNFKDFIDELLSYERERYNYYLTDGVGYFLSHPDPAKTFGFDLGHEHTAPREFPQMHGFFENSEKSTTFRQGNFLVHFLKCVPISPERPIAFGIGADYANVTSAAGRIARDLCLLILVFSLVSALLAALLAGRLTRPLKEITAASEGFLADQPESPLPVDRDDEIGTLAKAFQNMRTAIVSNEQDLVEKNRRLTELNRDLEHFARISSHELREPLRRISGLVQLYEIDYERSTAQERQVLLDQLRGECERALLQVRDFRVFSRITDGELKLEAINVNDLVESLLGDFREALEARNIRPTVENLPIVQANRSLLRVVYRNLIENALRHSMGNGIALDFTAVETGESLRLCVRNTGSSIEARHFESIFQPFNRVRPSAVHGSGMGLSICKRIVESYGGEIVVRSDCNSVKVEFDVNM